MTFEQDYILLLDFAKKNIARKKLLADPSDLVNDAFIKFIESGKEYKLSDIKSLIVNGSYKELTHEILTAPETLRVVTGNVKISYCNGCESEKPISGFYIHATTLHPFTLCKYCYINKQIVYYNSNKEIRLEKAKKWKEDNNAKVRLQKQEYYRKNKTGGKPVKSPLIEGRRFKKLKMRRRKFRNESLWFELSAAAFVLLFFLP